MVKRRSERQRRRWRGNQDHSDMIAMCLLDGPKTVAEIEQQFIAMGRCMGVGETGLLPEMG
jgi:hypothetical protein